MDREKANSILNSYGSPKMKVGDTVISFSRQQESNIDEIERKTDEDLASSWKGLVFMNYIYGQVSLNDLQRINLIELEIECRPNINTKELDSWYEKTLNEFESKLEH